MPPLPPRPPTACNTPRSPFPDKFTPANAVAQQSRLTPLLFNNSLSREDPEVLGNVYDEHRNQGSFNLVPVSSLTKHSRVEVCRRYFAAETQYSTDEGV